jgi:hypothetical protein
VETLGGIIIGVSGTMLAVSILARCRFGWHDWARWGWAGNGNGQNRECKRCGFTDVRLFLDGRVTIERVRPTSVTKVSDIDERAAS